MVTNANAQNPQNTNAWASPGSGRSRITLPCSITSHMKSQTRRPMGWIWKSGSFLECSTVRQTLPNRHQKPYADAASSTRNTAVSGQENWTIRFELLTVTRVGIATMNDGGSACD